MLPTNQLPTTKPSWNGTSKIKTSWTLTLIHMNKMCVSLHVVFNVKYSPLFRANEGR